MRGMCAAQMPKPAPLAKKTALVARRAATGRWGMGRAGGWMGMISDAKP